MIVYDRKTVTERELYYDRYCTCNGLPVCVPMIMVAPAIALYECLCVCLLHPPSTMTAIVGTPSWNDPLSMTFLFSSSAASSCSPRATPTMTDQEPSWWPLRTAWLSPVPPARTSSPQVVHGLHRSTSAPRQLPGCTPTADPPPQASHLGRGGERNLHAAAATGSTEDRHQTLPDLAHRSERWCRSYKNECVLRPHQQRKPAVSD